MSAIYIKNTAEQALGFCLVDSSGGAITGASVTARRSINGGSQATATGSVTELGNGQYCLVMSAADTNGDDITFLFTATSAVPVEKMISTCSGVKADRAIYLNGADGALGAVDIGRHVDVYAASNSGWGLEMPAISNLTAPQSRVMEVENAGSNPVGLWANDYQGLIAHLDSKGLIRVSLLNGSTEMTAVWGRSNSNALSSATLYRAAAIFPGAAPITTSQAASPSNSQVNLPYWRMMKLSSGIYVVVAGTYGDPSSNPSAFIATWSAGAWTFGSGVALDAGSGPRGPWGLELIWLSSTKFAVYWQLQTSGHRLIVCTVSGTTITTGSMFTLSDTQASWTPSNTTNSTAPYEQAPFGDGGGTNIYVAQYQLNGTSRRYALRKYTVSGTTVSFSSDTVIANTLSSVNPSYLQVVEVAPGGTPNGNALVIYVDGAAPTTYKLSAINNGTVRTPVTYTSSKVPLSGSNGFSSRNQNGGIVVASATKFIGTYTDGTVQSFDIDFSTGAITQGNATTLSTLISGYYSGGSFTYASGSTLIMPCRNEANNIGIAVLFGAGSVVCRGSRGGDCAIVQFATSGSDTTLTDIFNFGTCAGLAPPEPIDLSGSPNLYACPMSKAVEYPTATAATSNVYMLNFRRASNVWKTSDGDNGGYNGRPLIS